ncbi:MAG: dihydrodipicolinate synthase family protein, partial [Armatimonadota bacterium]
YFADIAEAVDIPIILYNFPAMTGTSVTPELVLSLARNHANIVGIKQTVATPDPLRDTARLVLPHKPDFRIFYGGDDLALYNLIIGGAGSIATSWTFAPEPAVALDRAFRAGDFQTARREQNRLSIISAAYSLDACLAAVAKEALFMLGKGPEPVLRKPALRLDESARAKLRQILTEAELLKS